MGDSLQINSLKHSLSSYYTIIISKHEVIALGQNTFISQIPVSVTANGELDGIHAPPISFPFQYNLILSTTPTSTMLHPPFTNSEMQPQCLLPPLLFASDRWSIEHDKNIPSPLLTYCSPTQQWSVFCCLCINWG